jgi:Fic family protein
VRWLMKIAEAKPFLHEYLGSPLEVKLLRRAKVRAITYSNQIEGNPLGESEVTAVLAGKRVAGSKEAVTEIRNYHEALDYVDRLASDAWPIRLADMCDLQKLVTRGTTAEQFNGKIRSIPVSIVNAVTGERIEECPAPHELRGLLDDLWRWLEDTKGVNPFVRAFAFHFIAVAIHPFADGNGRTVRLMQHLLILSGDEDIARFVPSETAIMRKRELYYSSIR